MPRRKDGFSGERTVVLPPETIALEAIDPLIHYLYITDIGYYPMAKHHYRNIPWQSTTIATVPKASTSMC